MKTIYIFLMLVCIGTLGYSQTTSTFCDSVFNHYDKTKGEYLPPPEQELQLANNLQSIDSLVNYPTEAIINKLEGDVFAWLSIDTTGKAQCLKLIRNTNTILDSVVINLLYASTFRTLRVNGVAYPYVSVKLFRFRLSSSSKLK